MYITIKKSIDIYEKYIVIMCFNVILIQLINIMKDCLFGGWLG